jgi:hypothetical protein
MGLRIKDAMMDLSEKVVRKLDITIFHSHPHGG